MTKTVADYEESKFEDYEYQNELALHKVKVDEKGAKQAFRKNYKFYLDNPKSGVFRDFKQYGVYPVRLEVMKFRLTIPFLVKFLSATQVRDEIVNQTIEVNRKNVKQYFFKHNSKSLIRQYPSIGDCYTLFVTIRDREKYKSFLTPIHQLFVLIHALVIYFNIPALRKIVKVRKEYIPYYAAILPKKMVEDELKTKSDRDPVNWGNPSYEAPTTKDAQDLVASMLIQKPYTPKMRQVMDYIKKVTFRHEFYRILERMREYKAYLIPSIRVVISKRDRVMYFNPKTLP